MRRICLCITGIGAGLLNYRNEETCVAKIAGRGKVTSPLLRDRSDFCTQTIITSTKFYAALSASTIFNRAARTEGRNPPANPINKENNNDEITIDGESAKENCSSENDW